MANEFATLQTIARQALPRLIDNLVFPNLVYRDFSGEFSNQGDTIQVRKPVTLEAREFDQASGVDYEDITERTVPVVLDKLVTVDAAATAVETAVNIDDLNRAFIEPAVAALAQKINADGLKLYAEVPYAVDASAHDLAALAAVRRLMNVNRVPTGGRVAVWDPEADAAFATIPAIVNAEKSGSSEALREGAIGRVFGLDNYMSQAVVSHRTGITAASGVKVAADVAAGATALCLSGTSLAGRLVKGDILTIAGRTYVVTEDTAAASGNAISSVKVYPALPVLAANTAVALAGSHVANLAFNPMAFAYVTRPLYNPDGEGVASYVTSYNGVSLRVTKGYDQKYKKSVYSMDVLYGYKAIYPELAVRAMG